MDSKQPQVVTADDSSWDSSLPVYSILSLHQTQGTITLPNAVTCSAAVSSSHLLISV